jgi:hypothetical protein
VPGDYLKAVVQRPDENGLQESVLPDACGQRLYLGVHLVELVPHCKLGRPYHLHLYLLDDTRIHEFHASQKEPGTTYDFKIQDAPCEFYDNILTSRFLATQKLVERHGDISRRLAPSFVPLRVFMRRKHLHAPDAPVDVEHGLHCGALDKNFYARIFLK